MPDSARVSGGVMVDETHEVDTASNSGSIHREPPPSLGMVAHIWAEHLGPVDVAAIELPSPEGLPATVD
jgi:hypothetical protein